MYLCDIEHSRSVQQDFVDIEMFLDLYNGLDLLTSLQVREYTSMIMYLDVKYYFYRFIHKFTSNKYSLLY